MDEVLGTFPFDARPLDDVQFNMDVKSDAKQILVELYQGKVSGLNKIVREGDCSAPELRGSLVVLECKLTLKGLKTRYFARVTKPDGKTESTTAELVAESGELAVMVVRFNSPCLTCEYTSRQCKTVTTVTQLGISTFLTTSFIGNVS